MEAKYSDKNLALSASEVRRFLSESKRGAIPDGELSFLFANL